LRDINSQPQAILAKGPKDASRPTGSNNAQQFTDKQKAQLFPEVLNENGMTKKKYLRLREAEQKTREQLQAAHRE
jgi:hypothetical protein